LHWIRRQWPFGLKLSSMSSPRSRYDGSLDKLHAALAPFVTDVSWLVYQDRANDPVKPEILVAHKLMLRALTHLSPNLSFSKSQLQNVFGKFIQEGGFKELADTDQETDWVETQQKRLHMACRHLAQARLRKPPPKWVTCIDGESEGSQLPMSQPSLDDSTPAGQKEEGEEEEEKTHSGAGGEDAQLPEETEDLPYD
jgi:hypothetical protein